MEPPYIKVHYQELKGAVTTVLPIQGTGCTHVIVVVSNVL